MYGKEALSSLKSHVRKLRVNSKQRTSNIKINTRTNNTSILNQESSGDSKAERVKKEAALLCSSGLCILVTDMWILGKHYIQCMYFHFCMCFQRMKDSFSPVF